MSAARPRVVVIGAGIGGLTAALCLHRIGVNATICESVNALRPLGVGINLSPHSVRVLTDLGLAERLDAIGVRTAEAALRRYEEARRPATAQIVRSHRKMGPERVMQIVEERAPDGFASLDDVIFDTALRLRQPRRRELRHRVERPHVGLDQRAWVMTRVERSNWKLLPGN